MVRTKVKGSKGDQPLAASKDASRDVLPRTGLSLGATFVDAASKLLASYGKFLVPLLVLVIAGFFTVYLINQRGTATEVAFKNKIDDAAKAEKLPELKTAMEVVIAEAEKEKLLVAYANYRLGTRAYQLLARPYKLDELKDVIGVIGSSTDKISALGESENDAWVRHLAGLGAKLRADLEFLENPANKARLPWDHHSKPDVPPVKEVESGNPVVVFVTEAGTLRIELYEDEAPNAVKHMVSLCEEGYYHRTDATTLAFSNSFNPTGPFKGATVVGAGRQGRPAGVKLEKPTTAKEGDDVDTTPVANPYQIEYQGSTTRRFEPGSIALTRDSDDPTRARADFFVVIEPSDVLGVNFLPLGMVLDGEKGLNVARRLHNAEIYYTYVESRRKGVKYVPRVFYDGWPVPMEKRSEVPKPLRFSKAETEIVPASSRDNPIVVIELEKGDIVIELYEDACPNTVANFINLIEEGFYNSDCEFYRVEGTATDIAEIYQAGGARIIQGGYDQSSSRQGYDYGIRNEAVDNERYKAAGLRNSRGTIAMARTSDLDSASTEFFINLKEYPDWDKEQSPYCVFGTVIYGLELVAQVKKDDAIKSAKVIRKRNHEYVPEVKYKEGGGWVKKKPVELPKPEKKD
ncbi:MAG: peptidylprolyl isomerase [Planctomycetes bacterium]|nr:peptidylprolyl isomerase [Planctomycetota bacterium]MCW8136756.1 peptidylprolyl isomerase [Planctomycetota bacterium]